MSVPLSSGRETVKGERLIQAYVDSVRERDSYKPQPLGPCRECEGDGILLGKKCYECNGSKLRYEEQTPARDSALKQAEAKLKIAYSKLNGSMLGEARRRLAARDLGVVVAGPSEEEVAMEVL
jgi:hypothetical protein